MKIYLSVCLALLCVTCGWGATFTVSAELEAVQAAVDSAQPGDTINVSATGTVSWWTPLVINTAVSLMGPGRDVLTISSPGEAIRLHPRAPSMQHYGNMITNVTRIEGFTFDANFGASSIRATYWNEPVQYWSNKCVWVAIGNNRFIHSGTPGSTSSTGVIFPECQMRGVIFSNIFDQCHIVFKIYGYDMGGGEEWLPGRNPVTFGSEDNLYIEGNTIMWSQDYTADSTGWNETGHSGRCVFRYNTWDYANARHLSQVDLWDVHGFQNFRTSDMNYGQTGTMIEEMYGNTITNNQCFDRWVMHRGGPLIMINNVESGVPAYTSVYQYGDENIGGDYPGGSACIPMVFAVIGIAPCFNSEVTNAYFLNNVSNGSEAPFDFGAGHYVGCGIAQNRNFWLYNPSFDGVTEHGIGRGTVLPAHCAPGDAFWVCSTPGLTTDPAILQTGKLYRGVATDTWQLWWEPYTFPHPLSRGVTEIFWVLGDSLGVGTSSPSDVPGGWRTYLYQRYTNSNMSCRFIGSNDENPGPGAVWHDCHGGYTTTNIYNNLVAWHDALSEHPTKILYCAGINDYRHLSGPSGGPTNELEMTIAALCDMEPTATLYVKADNGWTQLEPTNSVMNTYYSSQIPGIVARQAALGRRVRLVDARGLIDDATHICSDHTHYNAAGYSKTADIWFTNLTSEPSLSLSVSSLDFGYLRCSVSATNTVTVQNSGAGTLSGAVSVGSPFRIVGAASYGPLAHGESATVTIAYDAPGSAAVSTGTATFSGQGSAACALVGRAYPVMAGLTFTAGQGLIELPYVLQSGCMSQVIETPSIPAAGRATYGFTIITPGEYVISNLVNAASDGGNSYFISVDGTPESPSMISDVVPLTSGYEWRRASWRGAGTTSDQFDPKIWTLTAGTHYLVICGREPDCSICSIAITPYSLTPGTPPTFTVNPANLTTLVGQSATFSATAEGSAPMYYWWRHYATNVPGANSPSVTLPHVALTDAGIYSCIASNPYGIRASLPAVLTVVAPPSITSPEIWTNVLAGSTVTFTVTASGTAPLGYYWTHGVNGIGTGASLTLANVQVSDSGEYYPWVTNAYGVVQGTCYLSVTASGVAPSVTVSPVTQTSIVGGTATFLGTVTGTDPITYQWRFGGTNLPGQTTTSLVITNVGLPNTGEYWLVATNAFGTSGSYGTLSVVQPVINRPILQFKSP